MLTIETLRNNAARFAKEFAASHYEMGDAQDFIRDLCRCWELLFLCCLNPKQRDKVIKQSGKSKSQLNSDSNNINTNARNRQKNHSHKICHIHSFYSATMTYNLSSKLFYRDKRKLPYVF